MPDFALPPAAIPAAILRPLPLQIAQPIPEPPKGDGWLNEIKHDGHRLLAIVAGGEPQLISRTATTARSCFTRLTSWPPPGCRR